MDIQNECIVLHAKSETLPQIFNARYAAKQEEKPSGCYQLTFTNCQNKLIEGKKVKVRIKGMIRYHSHVFGEKCSQYLSRSD